MSRFGSIVIGTNVRSALESTLRKWMPTYLGEVAAQHGRDRKGLSDFRAYSSAATVNQQPENQLPSCILIVPGLAGQPMQHGDGSVTADWSAGVGFVVSSHDQRKTTELVELYAGAVRSCILQHSSLDGFATGTRWVDERYDDFGFDDSRSLQGGLLSFVVSVENVINIRQGPLEPFDDHTDIDEEWNAIKSTEVTTVRSQ